MLPAMLRRILTLLLLAVLAPAQAGSLTARIAQVTTPVATLHGVTVELQWPAGAASGQLTLSARQVTATDLGYRFDNLSWRCPLQRGTGDGGWLCAGELRSPGHPPMVLNVDLATATTDATLSRGDAVLALSRNAASPDLTRLDLTRVPLAWSQALLDKAWPAASLNGGTLSGRLSIETATQRPLRVTGRLSVSGLALDTQDGSTAAEGVGAQFDLDYRSSKGLALLTLDGDLRGGEILAGSAYVALPPSPVAISLAARRQGSSGWKIPQFSWDDRDALRVEGALGFGVDASLREADLRLDAHDLAPVRARYLSGWLGLFGLGELQLNGAMQAHLVLDDGAMAHADAELHDVSLIDAQQRFRLEGLSGKPSFSASTAQSSSMSWRRGALQGLEFGGASLPLRSEAGNLGLVQAVSIPMLGGQLRFDGLNLRPPADGRGMEFDLSVTVEQVDIGQVSAALAWPAFRGQLDGRIPMVRYANDRLDFEGTLTAQMFDGTVMVSDLAMERPFGTAPTLSADIVLDDLSLQSLTEVLGFGQITGALDGSIRQLRMVDWSPQSFDAEFHTDPAWNGRQRISQRAVQDISNVGGGQGGLGESLQAQALQLFEDFGYRKIGISCRLAEEVCDMDGLSSAGNSFSIVQGSGLPHLSVVGFNRRVDWPTLVERLVDITKGDSVPVIE